MFFYLWSASTNKQILRKIQIDPMDANKTQTGFRVFYLHTNEFHCTYKLAYIELTFRMFRLN